ncbi:MAG: nitrophenyl compound nitroreductase subunit ArsF family protein [Nitrospirota bacterium]
MVTTKKIVARLLMVFVLFSIAVLGYKEFVQGDNKGATPFMEAQPENMQEGQRSGDNKAFQASASKTRSEVGRVQVEGRPSESKVVAYYFHGKFRCVTCRTIEQYSRDAVHAYFGEELRIGLLEFNPVNVEEPENRHFVQDYELFSKSLVISLVIDGKEKKWKNLTDVWKLVRDKEEFFQYVKNEVEGFLREAR